MDEFIIKLYRLADALEDLNREFENLPQQFDGNDFEGQCDLANNILENMILAATHEAATVIRFTGNDIQLLARYINFRKQYSNLTDKELESIMDDSSLSMVLKLDLKKRLFHDDASLMLENIQIIRNSWNRTFDNAPYQKIINKFKRNN
jgi:hypothetical protein